MNLGASSASPVKSSTLTVSRVTALQPFNQSQFDACAAYFARKWLRPLTQLDLIKLHVLTDFFHILARGRPVIGGEFLPWQHGPVVESAYKRVNGWKQQFDQDGAQPPCLQIVGIEDNRCQFQAVGELDLTDFSQSEIAAMDRAVDQYRKMNQPGSVNRFFHDPSSYFGRAWVSARANHRSIDLIELIDEYDAETSEDHSDVKTLIR